MNLNNLFNKELYFLVLNLHIIALTVLKSQIIFIDIFIRYKGSFETKKARAYKFMPLLFLLITYQL
jgi:hypothetical protein